MAVIKFKVITIFPELFGPFLQTGLIGKALDKGLLEVSLHNLRDFSQDRQRTVDDAPYGGGAGMLFKVEPVVKALEQLTPKNSKSCRIYLSPRGKMLEQSFLTELLEQQELILLCGRYEGVDQRIVDNYIDCELSVGDYILNGGELPAMTLIEAISRLVPGVVGNRQSVTDDSLSRGGIKYPQYTRPAEFRGDKVPEVLRSGHQAKIEAWREEQAKRMSERKTKGLSFSKEKKKI